MCILTLIFTTLIKSLNFIPYAHKFYSQTGLYNVYINFNIYNFVKIFEFYT